MHNKQVLPFNYAVALYSNTEHGKIFKKDRLVRYLT